MIDEIHEAGPIGSKTQTYHNIGVFMCTANNLLTNS